MGYVFSFQQNAEIKIHCKMVMMQLKTSKSYRKKLWKTEELENNGL